MKDTAFTVPAAKVGRLPTCYYTDFATGKAVAFDEARASRFTRPPVFASGWGFGVSVITRRDALASVPGRFGWDGGYGTSW